MGCCALLAVVWVNSSAAGAESLEAQRAALYQAHGQKLAELAAWCRGQGLTHEADLAEKWLPPRGPGKLCLFVLDAGAQPVAPAADASSPIGQWQQRFTALRNAQAEALVALARQALGADRPALASMLLTEAVHENPDQAAARRALGYDRYQDRWCKPFDRQMLQRGNVWRDAWGWIPQQHVEKYEAGLRPFGTRWIDADEDARRHQDIADGWQIRTANYEVTTNFSLEEGVRLAARLEQLNQIWRQLFAGYWTSSAAIRRALDGNTPLRIYTHSHSVTYFRTRDQYNAALERAQPKIAITLGIYFDDHRRAYFFAGEDQHPGTLYHEATHQLFQETRRTARNVGRESNFWIIEGIAAYMESLTAHEGYFTLGGLDAGRVPAARERVLVDNFYIPLATLTAMSMRQVQSHPEIAKLYSQSAGLATFLMHDQEGRYREPLVRYLEAIYNGKAGPGTLAQLAGAGYDELDRQYREFLQGEEPERR